MDMGNLFDYEMYVLDMLDMIGICMVVGDYVKG